MVYLIAGLDRSTFARWHQHVLAADVSIATQIAQALSGELSIMIMDNKAAVDRVKSAVQVRVEPRQLVQYYWLALNQTDPRFQDVRVRQAFDYAIDRQAIITAVEKGYGKPANTAIVPGFVCAMVCVASTCSISLVPIPHASAPSAPCVEVWLSPQTIVMPGWVSPSCGEMTCTMPWFASPTGKQRIPNSRALTAIASI